MQRTRAITLATWLALLGACAVPWLDPRSADEGLVRAPAPPSRPLGPATYTSVLAPSSPLQQLGLAVDAGGHAWIAGNAASGVPGVTGVTELSTSGAVMRSIPFGSLVAADARGDVAFAGLLTAPIDLGLGTGTITPENDSDVLVVVLDHDDKVVFAKQLGLCADGISSLAISDDGRVAISGTPMGTAILSRAGDLQLQLTASGQLAFDSKGDLVVAAGDAATPPFLLAVDRNGAQVFEHVFDGKGVLMTGVTVDASDRVVFVGYTTDFIDVFGTYVQAKSTTESGRVTGAFLGELDGGWPDLGLDLGIVEANGVAAARDGTIYVAGAQTGTTAFDRIAAFGRLTNGSLAFLNAAATDGRDLGAAVDSSGNPFAAELRGVPAPGPTDARVLKLAAP
jgi:hypothetical protein